MSMMRMPSKGRVMLGSWPVRRSRVRIAVLWPRHNRQTPAGPIQIDGIGWFWAGLAVAAPHSAPYIPRVSTVARERSKDGTGYRRRLRRQNPQPVRAGPARRAAGAGDHLGGAAVARPR